MEPVKVADIIQLQRQYAPESIITLRKMKKQGKPLIAHCDDNVWEIPENNPAKSTYQGRTMERFETILREAHAVTTSTPYLKNLCLRFNPNVYIFRNLVEPIIADFKSPGRDEPDIIRLGWTGTPHHHDDIAPIEPLFLQLIQKYPNLRLVFMGYAPPTVLKQIPRKRWEYYEFVPVDGFYPALANLDFDIGIAPLADNGFNKGKTARKAQEYAILSVPMVLAPIITYRDWQTGETCLKPKENTIEEWFKSISWMIEHPKEREKLANAAHKQVMLFHDINRYISERAQVYYDVYKAVKGKEYGSTD